MNTYLFSINYSARNYLSIFQTLTWENKICFKLLRSNWIVQMKVGDLFLFARHRIHMNL